MAFCNMWSPSFLLRTCRKEGYTVAYGAMQCWWCNRMMSHFEVELSFLYMFQRYIGIQTCVLVDFV